MSTAAASAMFDERIDPGRISSFLLAAAMHLALFAVLMLGVRWQNRPPEAVVVELWNEPPAVQAEPKPAPKPEPAPEPAVVKPEPVIAKPEIAQKAPPPKPKPIVKAEPKPKPEPPKVAPRPRDEEAQRQIREQLNREQQQVHCRREHERRNPARIDPLVEHRDGACGGIHYLGFTCKPTRSTPCVRKSSITWSTAS